MDLSAAQILLIIQGLVILILSIAVHEFGHAYIADRLGDGLPRSQGRVTLNPLSHMDPIGTLLFPVLGGVFGGATFGWGRPVQVNPVSFSRRFRMRTGHMFVAAAGPAMNLLFGTFIALVHLVLIKTGVLPPADPVSQALSYAVRINFILMFFNLIPAPPLDGGAVLEGLLPDRLVPKFQSFAVYGPFVLMAVIFIPGLSVIFLGPATWLHRHLYGTVLFPLFGLS